MWLAFHFRRINCSLLKKKKLKNLSSDQYKLDKLNDKDICSIGAIMNFFEVTYEKKKSDR